MATLSQDKPKSFDTSPYARIPVIAADTIYQGAALGFSGSSGNVRPLEAGDVFAGFAVERCDNSAGAAAAKHDDIDFVVCTHLHHDHCGWNTHLREGRWVPTFPKARYVFFGAELSFAELHHQAETLAG